MKRIASLFSAGVVLLAANVSWGQNFWEPVSIPESPWFSSNVAVAPNNHVFALSDYYPNELFVSTDDGVSWSVANNQLAVRFPGVVLDHEGRIFGITDTAVICSSDEGKTWLNLRNGSFEALTVGFDDELYMVSETRTQGDSLLISNDHGQTWDANVIDTSLHGIGTMAVNLAGDIFATGSSGVFRSTDRGQSWLEKDAGIDYLYGIVQLLCDKHGEVFAGSLYGGTFAGLYFSTDNGESWTNAPWLAGTYDHVAFISLDSAGRIYAGSGAVWRSTDHGNTWIGVGSDFSPEPSTMAISKSGHIFTGEDNYVICRSTNGGNSWNNVSWWAIPSPIATGPDGELFLGIQPDGMMISTDNGNIWSHSPILNSNDAIAGIGAGLGGKIFASSIDDALYESRDAGVSWKLLYSGEPIVGSSCGVFINKGVVYADSIGTVVLSLDSGAEWSEADSSGINSIAGFAADSEGNIYVGGVYSTGYNYFGRWYSQHSANIFKSSDSGKTWLQVASNLTNDTTGAISSFGLTVDDSTGTIFAATNEGIYRSLNGSNWVLLDSLQGNVDGIVVASSEHIFAYNSMGVFYSTNDGDTWTPVNSGLKGLPSWSMSMAVNASGGLFVATDSGLFRSVLPFSGIQKSDLIPSFTIGQNSPNPFPQFTTISFTLPSPGYATFTLFDATGREVRQIASGYFGAGEHSVEFARGTLPAGVYFYRLEADGQSVTRAMVVQ